MTDEQMLKEIKERHNNPINSFVDGNDIDWLIKQAETLIEVRELINDEHITNSETVDKISKTINGD